MSDNKKKKVSFKIPFVIILCILSLTIGLAGGYFLFKPTQKETTASNSLLDEIAKIIENDWLDTTGSEDDMLTRMLNGLVSGLGDIHTSYMSASEISEFTDSINRNYEGIGVTFYATKNGALVSRVFDNTPASLAGIEVGDYVQEINGINVTQKTSEEIKSLIKTKQGTSIVMKVKRNQTDLSLTAVTASIETDVYYSIKNHIGYLDITTFGNTTGEHVKIALDAFIKEKVNHIVIDLRGNSGGYVSAANDILELFNKSGVVVYKMEDNKGKVTEYKSNNDDIYEFEKGVVLMDGSTASAAELLSAALRDIQGYQLIGEKSYGKGIAQTQATLSDSSVLKYTYAKWLTPKDECVQKVGLQPDVEVKRNTVSSIGLGEIEDALKVDSVNSKVIVMQTMLSDLGYDTKRVDGYFSTSTMEALNAFKKDHGLAQGNEYSLNDCYSLMSEYMKFLNNKEKDVQYIKAMELVK